MKLTAKTVEAARFRGKVRKLADGHGLTLHITRTGRKWRYRYRIDSKAREFTIGDADLVSLSEARRALDIARLLVQAGVDPVKARQEQGETEKAERDAEALTQKTAGQVISDWLCATATGKSWSDGHESKVTGRIKRLPNWFTALPVSDVTPDHITSVLQPAIDGNKRETAHRTHSYIRQALARAVALEFIQANPASHYLVMEALGDRPRKQKRPHIKDVRLFARLLADIDLYTGNVDVSAALRLLPMLFCRSVELRGMQWDELILDQAEWHIPAERMKMREPHTIPLPVQAVDIIRTQERRRAGNSLYVFAGRNDRSKPISDMTLGVALRRLGYGNDVIVPHGFRHTASTFINDGKVTDSDGHRLTFRGDVIEHQLAHIQGSIRATYNEASYKDERREMMQAWADWLDLLKANT